MNSKVESATWVLNAAKQQPVVFLLCERRTRNITGIMGIVTCLLDTVTPNTVFTRLFYNLWISS